MSDQPMSIMEHLEALRRALIVCLISLIPGAIAGWFIREDILRVLMRPVTGLHYKLVYLTPTEALTTEIKIAIFAGIAIVAPVIAYQIWKFVLPALHAHEKRYISIFVPFSVVLFIGGVVFGYYTVFLYGVQFLLTFGGESLTPMLSLGRYMSFSMWFLLPFGLIFELPLVILLLVRLGILTPQYLGAKRKWVLLAAFVIAAVATPTTDMITQAMMSGAIYVLYELSIWVSYLVRPKQITQLATAGETLETGRLPSSDLSVLPQSENSADITEERENAKNAEELGKAENLEEIYRNIIERGNGNDE